MCRIDVTKPIRTVQKRYPVTATKDWVEDRYTLLASWTSSLTGMKITTRAYDDGFLYSPEGFNTPIIENYEENTNDDK